MKIGDFVATQVAAHLVEATVLALVGIGAIALTPMVIRAQQDNTTALVHSVQDAGAGPLAGVSANGVYQWMTYHRDIAAPTAKQCAGIVPAASAGWFDSLEGSVCFGAIAAMASAPQESK